MTKVFGFLQPIVKFKFVHGTLRSYVIIPLLRCGSRQFKALLSNIIIYGANMLKLYVLLL